MNVFVLAQESGGINPAWWLGLIGAALLLLLEFARFAGLFAWEALPRLPGAAVADLFAAFDLAFCDPCQHLGVRDRRFGTKISVILRQITEVFRNRFHGVEGIIKPF